MSSTGTTAISDFSLTLVPASASSISSTTILSIWDFDSDFAFGSTFGLVSAWGLQVSRVSFSLLLFLEPWSQMEPYVTHVCDFVFHNPWQIRGQADSHLINQRCHFGELVHVPQCKGQGNRLVLFDYSSIFWLQKNTFDQWRCMRLSFVCIWINTDERALTFMYIQRITK